MTGMFYFLLPKGLENRTSLVFVVLIHPMEIFYTRFCVVPDYLYRNAKVEISIEIDQPVEVDHYTYQDHNHSSTNFNLSCMRLQPLQKPTKMVEAEAEQKKWYPQAERIG